jgi:hypothetical protein
VRKHQGSRLPKNLFGEQVGGSSTWERNPPKHDTLIVEMVYRPLTHSSLLVLLMMVITSASEAYPVLVNFQTEILRSVTFEPTQDFPTGGEIEYRTSASGSLIYETSVPLSDPLAFPEAPKIRLANQRFVNDKDDTAGFIQNNGLMATPTDWAVDLL